jgi:phage/plasmid-like protein (TIGR03299 family)
MADLIAKTVTGADAIAYVGETPWHGKGYKLTGDESLDIIALKAGLDYDVLTSPVEYRTGDAVRGVYDGRKVLYRSDNSKPLGILSDGYKIVQPKTVVEFFRTIVEREGAKIDVAGVLDEGQRVWVLAKLNRSADIFLGDIVEPYLLCATSYDGSMSTVAKLTGIRVVCNNTITAAVGYKGEGQSEKDRDGSTIRVKHTDDFDPEKTRIDLGIVYDQWESFISVQRKLARQPIDESFAVEFLKRLLPTPAIVDEKTGKRIEGDVTITRPFLKIMDLFKGNGIGAQLPSSKGTAFGLLNAVTEFVDHHRGSDSKRLTAAWFGTGEGLKNKAEALLEKVVA